MFRGSGAERTKAQGVVQHTWTFLDESDAHEDFLIEESEEIPRRSRAGMRIQTGADPVWISARTNARACLTWDLDENAPGRKAPFNVPNVANKSLVLLCDFPNSVAIENSVSVF